MEEKKKFKLHMPHVLTLIFFLIIVVAILTWILPSGEFERKVMETSAGERSVAVAGTYHSVDASCLLCFSYVHVERRVSMLRKR